MKTFPMFLKMAGRRVVVFGGGETAAQKARLIARAEAEICFVAPTLCPELEDLVASGRAHHLGQTAGAHTLDGAVLAFAASGCAGADAAHAALAKANGVLVNAVDAPDICDAFTPAIVDRDPVVVAIGTEGAAPVLARQIKTRIEGLLEPALGKFAAQAGALRDAVTLSLPRPRHRAFWAWVFSGPPKQALERGDVDTAVRLMQSGLRTEGRAQSRGRVSLVGAGPGAQDLITLRGVKRLQEADVILYDRLVAPEILDLARRDAERICVGKSPGDRCLPERWSQTRINRLILRLGSAGKQVVRLKSGDPGIFGRAEEEIAACRAAGIECEIVPGITAASGAAAEMTESQTARGAVDNLTLLTGTDQRHGVPLNARSALTPGTRLAIYMGKGNAAKIQAALSERCPSDLPVDIVASATRPDRHHVSTTLGQMAKACAAIPKADAAVIFVSYPKDWHTAAAAAADQDALTAEAG